VSLPGCRCEGLSVKLGLGTEGALVPGWDFHPETGGEGGEAPFLPSTGSGVRRRLPLLPPKSRAALCIFGRKSSLERDQPVSVPAPLTYQGLNFQRSFHEGGKH